MAAYGNIVTASCPRKFFIPHIGLRCIILHLLWKVRFPIDLRFSAAYDTARSYEYRGGLEHVRLYPSFHVKTAGSDHGPRLPFGRL